MNSTSLKIKNIRFTVVSAPPTGSIKAKRLDVFLQDLCDSFKDPNFAMFFQKHIPALEAYINLEVTPHSFPPTFNAEYRSMAELKAILIHEAWAHDVIARSGQDEVLIKKFRDLFPDLKNKFKNLSEEIVYRHVGVNALEAIALKQIFSPAVFEAYFKPQTRQNQNLLRSAVYESIYNLVTDSLHYQEKTNLEKIVEVLKAHSISSP